MNLTHTHTHPHTHIHRHTKGLRNFKQHRDKMAHGFGRHLLHTDKNVEKFAYFRENLINHYKWNLKSASFAVLFLAAIPVGLTYVGYKYQSVNKIAERRTTPIFTEYVPRS